MDRVSQCSSEYYGKLDRMAVWVGSSVVSAFFASLERCSCINLSTQEDEEDEDEAKDLPLMLSTPNGSQLQVDKNPAQVPDDLV